MFLAEISPFVNWHSLVHDCIKVFNFFGVVEGSVEDLLGDGFYFLRLQGWQFEALQVNRQFVMIPRRFDHILFREVLELGVFNEFFALFINSGGAFGRLLAITHYVFENLRMTSLVFFLCTDVSHFSLFFWSVEAEVFGAFLSAEFLQNKFWNILEPEKLLKIECLSFLFLGIAFRHDKAKLIKHGRLACTLVHGSLRATLGAKFLALCGEPLVFLGWLRVLCNWTKGPLLFQRCKFIIPYR